MEGYCAVRWYESGKGRREIEEKERSEDVKGWWENGER